MNSYISRRLVQILPPWAVLLRRIRIVLLPPLLLLGMVQYAQSQSVTVERRVSAGNDDAEERSSGSMYRSSSDLELVDDGSRTDQTVGMRFNGIDIPQGATILNSYVQLVATAGDPPQIGGFLTRGRSKYLVIQDPFHSA